MCACGVFSHLPQGSLEAVVRLSHVSRLPVTLPKTIPRVHESGVLFDCPRETLLRLRAVLGKDVKRLAA